MTQIDTDTYDELPVKPLPPEQRIDLTLRQLDAALACVAQLMGVQSSTMLDGFATDNGPRAKIERTQFGYILTKNQNTKLGS